MNKNTLWLFIIIAIFVGIGAGILAKWQINKTILINQPMQNQSSNTSNAIEWPIHLIDGTIEKIYSDKPFKLDVKVRVYKFLPNQPQKEIVKTIITKTSTIFVLRNNVGNKEQIIDVSEFKVGDSIAIWIDDINSNIFTVPYFIANKIIKYQ